MGGRAADRLSALADVVDRLRCPVCGGPVELGPPPVGGATDVPGASPVGAGPAAPGPSPVPGRPRVLACPAGHRFDVARQGHVVLVPGGSRLRADTSDMVAARVRVHASGAFDAVRSAVLDALGSRPTVPAGPSVSPDPLVLDVGAGPGTWAAAVLDACPEHRGLALELSGPALRTAARRHGRLAAVGADLTRPLPLVDDAVAAAGVVLAVFAPLPTEGELRRVTAPGSTLLVVTPTPAHLSTLRGRLPLLGVPAGKPERLASRLSGGWDLTERQDAVRRVRLSRALATDVVAMGPNAWHLDDGLRAALAHLPDEIVETVAVTVSRFERRDP